MENAGGDSMVGSNAELIRNFEKTINNAEVKESPLNWCSVTLSEVLKRDKRLEASVFDVEAKKARDLIIHGRYNYVPLLGENGLIQTASYPGRFKRIYCDRINGEPFYLPSQMTDIYPKPDKYISSLTKCNIDDLRLKENTLLLTRSGTIGNMSLVSRTILNKVFSDDVIRVTFKNIEDLGYTYAFLKSKVGNIVLKTNGYGSVITHLEPEHLAETPIPNPPQMLKMKVHENVMESFKLRDESNALIDMATDLLINELNLPSIEEFELDLIDESKKIQSFNVKLSEMSCRLDASYHVPIVDAIVKHLTKNAEEITTIGDSKISKDVVLPGRFKRVYVDEEYGVKFIGGKEVSQLDPSSEKYLSRIAHKKQLEGALGIKPYSILTPARGSLGNVTLPSEHFYSWAISDNMMQILSNKEFCGYVYIFLNSEYGKALIQRFTYGGVVDALEPFHIKEVQLPLLRNKDVQKQINDLALEANSKRYEAYKLEQQALKIIDNEVICSK